MIDIATPQSLVAEGLEAIRSEVAETEIFAAGNEQLIVRLNYTSDMPRHGVQEPKSSAAYGVGVPATVRDGDELRVGFGSESGDLSISDLRRAPEKARCPAVHDPDFISLPSPIDEKPIGGEGTGLYIGRIWYTYPINGLSPGDFTCTVVGDSYLIEHGKLGQPLKPNSIRINDNFIQLFQNVIGVTRDKKPTLIWSAEETVIAPELAVRQLHVENIAESMG